MINFTQAGCVNCHNGPMFSDFKLYDLDIPQNSKLDIPDNGNGNFEFRTMSLRNLTLTAPYMHNGVFNTLEEVMEFYDRNDDELDIDMDDDDIPSIIAFLKSLTDDNFDKEILKEVPSKLSPGGNMY